jgi:hypothetical protein
MEISILKSAVVGLLMVTMSVPLPAATQDTRPGIVKAMDAAADLYAETRLECSSQECIAALDEGEKLVTETRGRMPLDANARDTFYTAVLKNIDKLDAALQKEQDAEQVAQVLGAFPPRPALPNCRGGALNQCQLCEVVYKASLAICSLYAITCKICLAACVIVATRSYILCVRTYCA